MMVGPKYYDYGWTATFSNGRNCPWGCRAVAVRLTRRLKKLYGGPRPLTMYDRAQCAARLGSAPYIYKARRLRRRLNEQYLHTTEGI